VFFRISNYLNSKILDSKLEEFYLDLNFEDVLPFTLAPLSLDVNKYLVEYRKNLKALLQKVYDKFEFSLVGISCYATDDYLNSLEVALIIKEINPSSLIVVGGVHPTIMPEEFQPNNFPKPYRDRIPKNTSLFNYIIRNEGEIPFYRLVKKLMSEGIKKSHSFSSKGIILPSEWMQKLDDLPLINMDFLKKYQREISFRKPTFFIDFSRGCMFNCSFCLTSKEYIPCYKDVRIKSISKCIRELEILDNLEFKLRRVTISDPIFLPKKSKREEFFQELKRFYSQRGKFHFDLTLFDRVDFCSESDLGAYQDLGIFPNFGLESVSETLLKKIKKTSNTSHYLKSFENIIKKSNELDLFVRFTYLANLPGETRDIIREIEDFFFEKRFEGRSLVEKFKINIGKSYYVNYPRTEIYENYKEGSRNIKRWWRVFDKYQFFQGYFNEPSKDFTFLESVNLNSKIIKQIHKNQGALENQFYLKENADRMFSENTEKTYLFYKLLSRVYKHYKKKQIKTTHPYIKK
jgi:radical SAM superfamily enzyme YgiQ (UPF0313 family)